MLPFSENRIFASLLPLLLAGCSFQASGPKTPNTYPIGLNNPPIRVLLINSVPEITIVANANWKVETLEGNPVAELPRGTTATISLKEGRIILESAGEKSRHAAIGLESAAPGGVLEIKKVPYGVGWWWAGTQDRTYEGRIEVRPGAKGFLEVIVVLPMEDYLPGVVPTEIGPTSPQEALRAQAVAARSEALMALITRKYAGVNYDIGSDVESQAFSGNTKRTAQSDESVRATRGLALLYEGRPISAFYASSCGGHTEDIRNVWPNRAGEKAYWDTAVFDGDEKFNYDLTREDDLRRWLTDDPKVFCNPSKFEVPNWASKNFRWEREVTAEELSKWVASHKDIGRVVAIRAVKRGPSGRMIEAEFKGEKDSFITGPELAIRQVLEPPLKSAAFVVDTQGPAERPERFILRGAGWGHGVGMCQTGAIAMAHAGKTFREILAHYYPSSRVETVYP